MPTLDPHLDSLRDDLVAFAQRLVQTQSYSGQEEAIARLIAAQMTALGFAGVTIDSLGSVIGRLGNGPTSILFDSHIDTVTVNDAAEWDVPPFSGALVDGSLWGRGSVDMKSGLAASLYAAVLAHRLGLTAGKSVYVSCTVFEEDCDGENLKHLFQELALRPDFAIVCEPSGNQIALGHKGKAQVTITTQGVSAHGSAPEKGYNAVYEMAEIIQRVEQTNARLTARPAPRGTLVLSRISSVAASLNAVPSECEIYLDRRIAPGETQAAIHAEMDALVAGKRATWQIGRLHRTSWTGQPIEYQPFHLAWQLDPSAPLAQAAAAAYADSFGRAPGEYAFWDFSTNAVTTVALGIPTLGFGPGDHKLAHMRNEHCPIDQIIDACRFYTHLIERL